MTVSATWANKRRMIMSDTKAPTITKVVPVDAKRAIATQVMAFSADPVMRWIFPEAREYLEHFPSFVRVFGGRALENATCYATENFGAVSMWFPPGVEVDGAAFGLLLAETGRPENSVHMEEISQRMGDAHIKEPHWYLAILGVEPAMQGSGFGSLLLRHRLERIDEQGLPAYLESSNPKNVPLYQRHGFEVIQEIQVGTCPTFYPMLRPARYEPAA